MLQLKTPQRAATTEFETDAVSARMGEGEFGTARAYYPQDPTSNNNRLLKVAHGCDHESVAHFNKRKVLFDVVLGSGHDNPITGRFRQRAIAQATKAPPYTEKSLREEVLPYTEKSLREGQRYLREEWELDTVKCPPMYYL